MTALAVDTHKLEQVLCHPCRRFGSVFGAVVQRHAVVRIAGQEQPRMLADPSFDPGHAIQVSASRTGLLCGGRRPWTLVRAIRMRLWLRIWISI